MTVTGRTYTSTRPRGLAEWNPQSATRVLLDAVLAVIDEYRDLLPLTGRQVFYRLVATGIIDKTEKSYGNLLEKLNRARRAGIVPWNAIRDDGVTLNAPWSYTGPAAFWSELASSGHLYRRNRLDGQAVDLEVWVEAAGMVPQAERIARPYSIPVQSSGGFDSVTAKHAAARRFLTSERPTVVLHLGDLDPSGCALIDSLAEDIDAFCEGYGRPGIVTFERIAVTPAQVVEHRLPTAPQKRTDRRGEEMAETVQAEAFSPDVLAEVIADGIADHVDPDQHDRVLAEELAERGEILAELERLTGEIDR